MRPMRLSVARLANEHDSSLDNRHKERRAASSSALSARQEICRSRRALRSAAAIIAARDHVIQTTFDLGTSFSGHGPRMLMLIGTVVNARILHHDADLSVKDALVVRRIVACRLRNCACNTVLGKGKDVRIEESKA